MDGAALLTFIGVALTALGALTGVVVKSLADRRTASDSSQDRLIDQLQEELGRYRADNDKRIDRLDQLVEQLQTEIRGYRAFIGVQRDHMAAHGIPLPEWPANLPR